MIKNDNFKFRLEVSIKPPQKGFNHLNSYIIWYNRAVSHDDPEMFDDVTELGDPAFRQIATWIADEYLLSKVSQLKNFAFGNYGYETGSTNTKEHDDIFWKLRNMILDCLIETFNYSFLENNKDNLELWTFYEYIFDVSFEIDGDNLKRTKLDVKHNTINKS